MNKNIPIWKAALICLAVALAFASPNIGGCDIPSPFGPAEGPRHILIVSEHSGTTGEWGRLVTELRDGKTADYLKEKGHRLDILDADSTDQNDTPDPLLAKFKPFDKPELLILTAPEDKLIHREKMPATADGFLTVVKAHGG